MPQKFQQAFEEILNSQKSNNPNNKEFRDKVQKEVYRYCHKNNSDFEIESTFSEQTEISPRASEKKRREDELKEVAEGAGEENQEERYYKFVYETMPSKKEPWYIRPHHLASITKHHLSPQDQHFNFKPDKT